MNLHGLGDNDNNRSRPRNMNLMGGNQQSSGDPRKEGFLTFLRDFCCPMFIFKSVIFFVSCADLIIYIITLCYGIELNPNKLLAPRSDTLDTFGMKVS
jgi:hypothetical protein